MGPKVGKLTRFAAVALASLALSSGAQAAFVAYSGSGAGASTMSFTSAVIDLGSLVTAIDVTAGLGLSVESDLGTTVGLLGQPNLQVVQGCASAAISCSGASWVNIGGLGLGVGFPAPPGHTEYPPPHSVSFTGLSLPGAGYESFRLVFGASFASPEPESSGVSGSLRITAVPEPGTWAMMLAGVIGIAGIARRRIG